MIRLSLCLAFLASLYLCDAFSVFRHGRRYQCGLYSGVRRCCTRTNIRFGSPCLGSFPRYLRGRRLPRFPALLGGAPAPPPVGLVGPARLGGPPAPPVLIGRRRCLGGCHGPVPVPALAAPGPPIVPLPPRPLLIAPPPPLLVAPPRPVIVAPSRPLVVPGPRRVVRLPGETVYVKGRPSVVVQPSPPVVVTQKPQIIYKPGPTRPPPTRPPPTRPPPVFQPLPLTRRSPPRADCTTDILFILDSSGSVRRNFQVQKTFVEDVIRGLSLTLQQVGVVTYAGRRKQRLPILLGEIQDKDALLAAVKGLPHIGGTTSTPVALRFARESGLGGRRAGVPLNIIVVTDGFSWEDPAAAADDLRAVSGTTVYAAGVVPGLNRDELRGIAGDERRVFSGDGAVQAALNRLQGSGCGRPAPPKIEAPPIIRNPTRRPFRDPTTTTTTRRPTTTARRTTRRRTTTTTTTPRPTQRPAQRTPAPPRKCFLDILFVLDASGSVKKTFQAEKTLIKEVVERLTLGEYNARVALIRFAGRNRAETIFPFRRYSTKTAMSSAVQSTRFIGGTTYLGDALDLAGVEFSAGRGARLGEAKPVAIIFTDGFSWQDPLPAARALQERGIHTYAVGINDGPINRREMVGIAGAPERVYTNDNFDAFQAELTDLTREC